MMRTPDSHSDEMLVYLTSDASAMTTGACITLDDGQTL